MQDLWFKYLVTRDYLTDDCIRYDTILIATSSATNVSFKELRPEFFN